MGSNLMTKSFERSKSGEAGFSLMELIVAIGIIVAIAAVTIPLVTRFAGTGTSGAQTAELENVQTAIDTLVAEAAISSVDARTGPSTATQVWTSLPDLGRGCHSGRWFQRRPGGLYEDDIGPDHVLLLLEHRRRGEPVYELVDCLPVASTLHDLTGLGLPQAPFALSLSQNHPVRLTHVERVGYPIIGIPTLRNDRTRPGLSHKGGGCDGGGVCHPACSRRTQSGEGWVGTSSGDGAPRV